MTGVFGDERRVIRLGRYELRDLIGGGGMGQVFEAWDPVLGRTVAVKLVRPAAGGETQWRSKQLRNEARALASLSHPNVVPVYEAGIDRGQVFIAMERVDGIDLAAWLERHPSATWPEKLELLLGAALGVVAAHERGIVHRDIKPQNILVGVDGRVRVADFGLANPEPSLRALHSTDSHGESTATSGVFGTPRYMAPEQHAGQRVGPAADQFAWSVTAFEVLFGCAPFHGGSAGSLAAAKREGRVTAVDTHGVPRSIRRVLERGFAAAPADRWPSMDALVKAIAQRRAPRRGMLVGAVGAGMLSAMAFALPLPAASTPVAAPTAAVEVPPAPSAGQAVRARLAAAYDLEMAAEYAGAAEETAAALHDAVVLGSRPLIAAASVQAARQQGLLGDVRGGAAAMEAAFELAMDAGEDRLAGVAADALVRVYTEHLAQYADALRWARHAESLLDRVGADSMARAHLHAHRGFALRALGRLDEARAAHQAALELREAVGDQPRRVGESLDALGTVELQAGHLDEAADYFERALSVSEAALPAGHPSIASTVSNLANVYVRRGELPRARVAFARAVSLMAATHGEDHPPLAKAVNNLAVVAAMQEDFEAAADGFSRALRLSSPLGVGHPERVSTLLNLGTAQRELGGRQPAHDTLRRALAEADEAEALPDGLRDRINVQLAWVELEAGDCAAAVRRAGKLREVSDPATAALATVLTAIAQHRLEPAQAATADTVRDAMADLDGRDRQYAAAWLAATTG